MVSESNHTRSKKLTWLVLITVFLTVVVLIIGYIWHSRIYPSTDDAYVQAHVVSIAPQVSGLVKKVFIENHQLVQKGQVLLVVNDRVYKDAVAKARAELELAQSQSKRIFPLIKHGRIAPAEGDEIKARLTEAEATLSQAEYNLAHTIIKAPITGVVADFNIRRGDTVTQGIDLFAIVDPSQFWVDANFKETQMQRIKVGQKVSVEVDMYPDYTFEGVVMSISPSSGGAFALLPPENATGNWVKVTQRIPVRVLLTNPNEQHPLIIDTSATVTVDTKNES